MPGRPDRILLFRRVDTHIVVAMKNPATKPSKHNRPTKAGATYRGVQIQPTPGRSRFSAEQIRKAVQEAIEKNPDAFVSRR